MKYKLYIFFGFIFLCFQLGAQNLDRAELYFEHGLIDKAKNECILLITSDRVDSEKIQSYYLLGLIALSENRNQSAIETWSKLVELYPNSKQAREVTEKMEEIRDTSDSRETEIINAVKVEELIGNGEFWYDETYYFDTSYLIESDIAIYWYDKVIEEFPGTEGAKKAFEKKIGLYSHSIPRLTDEWAEKYLRQMEETVSQFLEEYPNAAEGELFVFLLGQALWSEDEDREALEWFNKLIEDAGDRENFYTDLAKRRRENIYEEKRYLRPRD